jgi:hypothetical protein
MKFTTFKKIYSKADRISFETKRESEPDTRCYITDGFTLIGFPIWLKSQILNTLGMSGCTYDCFCKERNGEVLEIEPKKLDQYLGSYTQGESNVIDTNIIIDLDTKSMRVLKCDKGFIAVNNEYIKMVKEILEDKYTIYKNDKENAIFFGDSSITIMVLPVQMKKAAIEKYFIEAFII